MREPQSSAFFEGGSHTVVVFRRSQDKVISVLHLLNELEGRVVLVFFCVGVEHGNVDEFCNLEFDSKFASFRCHVLVGRPVGQGLAETAADSEDFHGLDYEIHVVVLVLVGAVALRLRFLLFSNL